MARPRLEIDWDEVEKLCALHCTAEEIANFINVSTDTLSRRIKEQYNMSFIDYYSKYSHRGNVSLRRKQMELAMSGDRVMLIFLGKNYLGQSDNPDKVELDYKKFNHDKEIDDKKYW